MKERIKAICNYSPMIASMVRRELRGRYKGSVLGFLWTFINPLCQIIVYTIVFSYIAKNGLNQFYIYLIVGMIPWLFFDNTLRQGSRSIRYEGDLIKKVYFPREVLPISCTTTNFVNMLLCFLLVFGVIFVSGWGFDYKLLVYLPIIMMIEYILCLGFSLIVAAGTVYFKDLENIVNVLLMAWIYGTPIMYSIEAVPEGLRWLFVLNPMTAIVQSYQNVLYWKKTPGMTELLYAFLFGIVVLVIGEIIFAKLEDCFAEEL